LRRKTETRKKRIAEKTSRSHFTVENRKLEKNANCSNLTLKKQSRFEKKTDDFLKIGYPSKIA
jgi:hypothetical protein